MGLYVTALRVIRCGSAIVTAVCVGDLPALVLPPGWDFLLEYLAGPRVNHLSIDHPRKRKSGSAGIAEAR